MAYSLLTQFWLAVYVVSLQRNTKKPLVIHIRRLNAVVRVAQKRPAKIIYIAMIPTGTLECHADSGFSREQDKGYGIRGLNMMRQGKAKATKETVWHLLDSQCRSHKHVTRCSFSSETRAAVVAADELIALGFTLHEFAHGPQTPLQGREIMEHGGSTIETVLVTDSMSLWSGVAAATVRVTTEKNLAVQLFWLREMLDKQVLKKFRWCDTRD